ncbi:MAG: hypothetical protein C5B60_00105 [Chloroflexi bacterium]|nr:MAG: hypothetical protein C5B60_00105 [Chloroflexota bacterium]
MAKFRQDLTLYQGDDWAAMVCVNNSDGTAADLNGYSVQAHIREGVADQSWDRAAELTCAIVLPNQISISLTNRQTTQLTQPSYRWDLQIVSPDGITTTIMAGQVRVLLEVTRCPPNDLLAAAFWEDIEERYLVGKE